jgi:transaldolase
MAWCTATVACLQMAVEKLAQGIEGFAADQRKLEALLADTHSKMHIF